MPGPNGPRSAKLQRGTAASATKTPFLVPIERVTRSATSISRNGRKSGYAVARRQWCVDALQVAHVVRIHEHVQVPAHRSSFITDVAIERSLIALELLERSADGVCRDRQLLRARAVRAQRSEDMKRDR